MAMFKKTEDVDICPLLKEKCIQNRCHFWTSERVHPEAGDPSITETRYDCDIHWIKLFMKEAAIQQNQTSAAIETFRNESVNNAKALALAMISTIEQRLRLSQENKP